MASRLTAWDAATWDASRAMQEASDLAMAADGNPAALFRAAELRDHAAAILKSVAPPPGQEARRNEMVRLLLELADLLRAEAAAISDDDPKSLIAAVRRDQRLRRLAPRNRAWIIAARKLISPEPAAVVHTPAPVEPATRSRFLPSLDTAVVAGLVLVAAVFAVLGAFALVNGRADLTDRALTPILWASWGALVVRGLVGKRPGLSGKAALVTLAILLALLVLGAAQ